MSEGKIEALVSKEINAIQDGQAILQVLIVDADPRSVANVAAVVLSEGHRANKCHQLSMALTMVEILNPHVILIDAGLICDVGIDAYRELRQTPIGASATIVAIGWGLEQQVTLDKLDFDYRLTQPTSPTVLREILRAAVDNQS